MSKFSKPFLELRIYYPFDESAKSPLKLVNQVFGDEPDFQILLREFLKKELRRASR